MKYLKKKIVLIPLSVLAAIVFVVVILDWFILPWYVSAPEFEMPNLINKHKVEAINILKSMNLNPIEQGPKFDENVPKDRVIYHRPRAGTRVKEGRRVYLFISGGEPLLKAPILVGKTFRDAKITIERLGLELGEIENVRSEFAANTVIGQDPEEDSNIEKGTIINLKVSVGPRVGMIRVPNIYGKSLTEAGQILRSNSLKVGRVNYQVSPNLVPNTVIDQIPSEGKLLSVGDSVDVWVTKAKVD